MAVSHGYNLDELSRMHHNGMFPLLCLFSYFCPLSYCFSSLILFFPPVIFSSILFYLTFILILLSPFYLFFTLPLFTLLLLPLLLHTFDLLYPPYLLIYILIFY